MSTEATKAVITAFSDAVWRNRDLAAIDRFFSDRYEDPEIPGDPRDGLKQFFAAYFAARPDFRLTSEECIAEGERVVQYITGEFTNTIERLGPLGAKIEMQEINIFTVRDGKIVSRRGIGRSAPAGRA